MNCEEKNKKKKYKRLKKMQKIFNWEKKIKNKINLKLAENE